MKILCPLRSYAAKGGLKMGLCETGETNDEKCAWYIDEEGCAVGFVAVALIYDPKRILRLPRSDSPDKAWDEAWNSERERFDGFIGGVEAKYAKLREKYADLAAAEADVRHQAGIEDGESEVDDE